MHIIKEVKHFNYGSSIPFNSMFSGAFNEIIGSLNPYRSVFILVSFPALIFVSLYYSLLIMANKAKKNDSDKHLKLEIVNPFSAGIDVSATEMQVCVPPSCDADNNRCFGTFTEDLHFICCWLKACGITTVAMESTGVYWIPLYLQLVDEGFDVTLGNARAIKNITEKKTDKVDAEWLMLLHSYGLIKPSFHPENSIRSVRSLTRQRDALVHSRSREVQHMQKTMELMNIKLSNVIRDIMGKSGQDIIKAILDGERDPKVLASFADPRCKSSSQIIESSLQATWKDEELFVLKQSYALYLYMGQQIREYDTEIEKILKAYSVQVLEQENLPSREILRSGKKTGSKNKVGMDIEKYAAQLWGVNLMCIPGFSDTTLLKLVSELGGNFTDKFEDAKHFCKWCNLVPNNKISGGKLISSRLPKKKNPVGLVFRGCANTLLNSKSSLGIYFRRVKSKKGYMQAIVATANKLARIVYTMIKSKQEYDQTREQEKQKEVIQRKLIRAKLAVENLQKMIDKCA